MKSNLLFTKEGLKKMTVNGSLFPSSKYLAKQMIKKVKPESRCCIVELGAGTGIFTKYILEILPKDGKLFVIEINPIFVEQLKKLYKNDSRIVILEANASEFGKAIARFGYAKADYILSGLPLANIDNETRKTILEEIQRHLFPTGLYIQFQYLIRNFLEIRKKFDCKISSFELRNFPPAFVYTSKLRQQ